MTRKRRSKPVKMFTWHAAQQARLDTAAEQLISGCRELTLVRDSFLALREELIALAAELREQVNASKATRARARKPAAAPPAVV